MDREKNVQPKISPSLAEQAKEMFIAKYNLGSRQQSSAFLIVSIVHRSRCWDLYSGTFAHKKWFLLIICQSTALLKAHFSKICILLMVAGGRNSVLGFLLFTLTGRVFLSLR